MGFRYQRGTLCRILPEYAWAFTNIRNVLALDLPVVPSGWSDGLCGRNRNVELLRLNREQVTVPVFHVVILVTGRANSCEVQGIMQHFDFGHKIDAVGCFELGNGPVVTIIRFLK